MRQEAVGRLGPLGAPFFVQDVLQALSSDMDQNVRWTAAVAAGQLMKLVPKSEAGAETVDEPAWQREQVVGSCVELLQELMEDEEEEVPVRMAAQDSLRLLMPDSDEEQGEEAGDEDVDHEEEDDSDSDSDDDDDTSDNEDEEDRDGDSESGPTQRIAAAQQRIRPHPPAALQAILDTMDQDRGSDDGMDDHENHSADPMQVKAPPRDPTVAPQLADQLDALAHRGGSELPPIDTATLAKEDFEGLYRATPQILQGVTKGWAAATNWADEASLLARWGGKTRFRVGDDETNEPVLMRLSDYLHYARTAGKVEANPLYLFDMKQLDKDEAISPKESESDPVHGREVAACKELVRGHGHGHVENSCGDEEHACGGDNEVAPAVRIRDYTPRPHYFADDDLFSALPAEQRPPHRWVLVGCEGKGQTVALCDRYLLHLKCTLGSVYGL